MSNTKRRLDPRNTTGYTGVYRKRQKFRAQIKIDCKTFRLGIYDTPKEAGLAYDRAVIQHKLAASRLNFPNGLPLDDKDYEALMNPTKKRRLSMSNTSGYTGVYKVRHGFQAKITVGGQMKYLGIYDTPEEAAFAYDRAVVKYKLASSKLNYPDGNAYTGMNSKKNMKKKRRLDPRNTTGYTGVIKRRKRFQAQIKINRKHVYLGTYDTPKEAALAYDRAVVQHKLSYSKLNFPHDWSSSSSDEDENDGDEGLESLNSSFSAQPLFHRDAMLDQLVAEEENQRQLGEQEEYVEVEVGSADIQLV